MAPETMVVRVECVVSFRPLPRNRGLWPDIAERSAVLYRSGHGPRFEDPQRRPGASEGCFCSGLQVVFSTPPVFLYFVENLTKMQLLFAFFSNQPVMPTGNRVPEQPWKRP
jgi:hypothetical protein